MQIQQWISTMASLLPFGYAFGAGMVAAVNPCGFSMLPVYLTLYLGANNSTFHNDSFWKRLGKAIWVASVVTAGFALLFSVVGIIVSVGGNYIVDFIPKTVLFVGIILIFLGCWLLIGKQISIHFFHDFSTKIGDPRNISLKGFFLFGIAFGAASLSCTLPIFLMVVGSSLATGNFFTRFWHFICYVLGMGSIMLILTLGIALLREGVVVGLLRKVMPWIEKISALLLLIAGIYIVYHYFTP